MSQLVEVCPSFEHSRSNMYLALVIGKLIIGGLCEGSGHVLSHILPPCTEHKSRHILRAQC